MAVANHNNDASYNTESPIYRFNQASDLFELLQVFDTNGAQDWEAFAIGDTTYVAVANHRNDFSYSLKAQSIFRVHELCWRDQ